MDPRLLDRYNQELGHLREMGAEFAKQFPKVAGRLGLETMPVSDPYVERLLEGFAFLAARVQVRLDAEFPRFTDRLLETVYPNALAPVPSMLIARFHPNMGDPSLAAGAMIERGTLLRGLLGKGENTECRFRTAQPVRLWPIELTEAQYLPHVADLPSGGLGSKKPRAGIRIRLRATGEPSLGALGIESLRLHFTGQDETAYRIYERLLGHTMGVLVLPAPQPGKGAAGWKATLPATCLKDVGFTDEEALLPATLRGFQGYRLLQEYFAFPQRFMFADVVGLAGALAGHDAREVDLYFLLDQGDPQLEGVLAAANFALHCAPAVNLFEHRCDRIQLSDETHDHHVVPDRTQPLDYEVYELLEVKGHGAGSGTERNFVPMYAAYGSETSEHDAYYCLQREPRLASTKARHQGARSSYIGSEAFVSLVDPQEAPYAGDLRQLSVRAICSNRDLPLHMPIGLGRSDFTLDISAPVDEIRVASGPSKPSSRIRDANLVWRFVNHLSLNHLSLTDTDPEQGASALREMLDLYAVTADKSMTRQIEGVRHVRVKPVVRRLPAPGRITFGRVLEIEIEVDELAFQGASAYLLGSVLSRFFARYVTINSHTETVLRSLSRGEVERWSAQAGSAAVL
ncbi:type VI secretion system baseplate subunit TssF [soil metagenome]